MIDEMQPQMNFYNTRNSNSNDYSNHVRFEQGNTGFFVVVLSLNDVDDFDAISLYTPFKTSSSSSSPTLYYYFITNI